MSIILGLSGQSGVGKDTMADYLAKECGFVKISLADPLKRICREVYGFSDKQLWGPSEERNKPDLRYPTGTGYLTPRRALQILGTEWGRNCYEDTWTDYAMRVAEQILAGREYDVRTGIKSKGLFSFGSTEGVVIPDVRFKNEIKRIRTRGGLVVRLKRYGHDGTIAGGVQGHASEEEQKSIPDTEFDAVLDVPEGYKNFYSAIDKLFEKLPRSGRMKLIP